MKSDRIILTLSLFACASLFAQSEAALRHAEMPNFEVVDTDNDGFLSHEEARVAFNDLTIEDTDGDGIVAKGEAESAIPGLRFTNDTHEDFEMRVGPADYAMMAEQFLRGFVSEETDH